MIMMMLTHKPAPGRAPTPRRAPTSAGASSVVRAFALAATAMVLVLTGGSPAAGAPPARTLGPVDPGQQVRPVGDAVSRELARIVGVGARADDSSSTACMTVDAEPLAYSTRQIVVRAQLSPAGAKAAVQQAINVTGSPGRAISARRIPLPPVPGPAPELRAADAEALPLLVVEVGPRDGSEAEVEVVSVTRRLRLGDVEASPNYLLSPSDGSLGVWPNGYPKRSTLVTTPRTGRGSGAVVWVYDGGLAPSGQSDRPPNVTELVLGTDAEELDIEPRKGVVDRYYGGHTVAIADVFATIAPEAEVFAVKITGPHGVATDVSAATRMARTLIAPSPDPDVIVNSFGSPACNVSANPDDGEMVPLGLEAVVEAVEGRNRSVVVAAAGNRSSGRAFYPGGFDTQSDPLLDAVVGVGALELPVLSDPATDVWAALSRSAPVADYSNFGEAVEAWAPGSGLPVRHVDGLRFRKGSPVLRGRAEVDGTSFAAPYVGALIAEQMATGAQSAPAAWKAVLLSGNTCTVGGSALALVSMDAAATTETDLPPEC